MADEQGVVLQINPAGERLWGYACNEVVGQPASMFSALPPAEAAALMGEVLAALHATGSWRGTFRNRRKDGVLVFCEAAISRLEVQGRKLMVMVEQDDRAPPCTGTTPDAGARSGEHGGSRPDG